MQTFTLDSYTFTAPDQVGAGIVQTYQTTLRRAFLRDCPEYATVTDGDDAERTAAFEAWLADFATSTANTVLILDATLTAVDPTNTPSMKALYDGLQDASAAVSVVDFFSQGVQRVMQAPSPSRKTGAASKGRPTARRKK
jgi:hypothetical protein